VRKHLFAADGC
jgi:hypothetical protein